MKTIEVGKSYKINDILFATNSYELTKASKLAIETFIEFMNDNQSVEVELQGHTDNVGSAEYNLTLSENRANAVYQYLISKGIAENRLTYKGYGQEKPIADNSTVAGRAKNRRTIFLITKK